MRVFVGTIIVRFGRAYLSAYLYLDWVTPTEKEVNGPVITPTKQMIVVTGQVDSTAFTCAVTASAISSSAGMCVTGRLKNASGMTLCLPGTTVMNENVLNHTFHFRSMLNVSLHL